MPWVPSDDQYQPLNKSRNWTLFATSHRFLDIHISKLVTLKTLVKVVMNDISSGAIRWEMHNFLFYDNSNVCIFTAFAY